MSTLRGTARLLRLPLFVTAVADALAAYGLALLAGGGTFQWRQAALLAATATGLYLFGMVQNDVVDVRRDRELGVPRPLVTGEARLPHAVFLMVATAAVAAGCAWILGEDVLIVAGVAFAMINSYNLAAKHGPASVAMPVMGLCRVANAAVGVVVAIGVPHVPDVAAGDIPMWAVHWIALLGVGAVASGYSIAARRRNVVSTRPWQVFLVVTVAATLGLLAFASWAGPQVRPWGLVLHPPLFRGVAGVVLVLLWPGRLWSRLGTKREPDEYAPFIERLLYWLIVLDVAFVLDAAVAS